MLHCLFSEHNLFLTQNNNPTLFSLPVLAFYYFQVLRPVSLASRCAGGGNGLCLELCYFTLNIKLAKLSEGRRQKQGQNKKLGDWVFALEKNCEICGRLKKTMEYRSNVYAVHRKIVTKETSALKRKKEKTDRNQSKEKNTKRFFVKATADEVIHGDGWSTHLLVSCLLTGHFV